MLWCTKNISTMITIPINIIAIIIVAIVTIIIIVTIVNIIIVIVTIIIIMVINIIISTILVRLQCFCDLSIMFPFTKLKVFCNCTSKYCILDNFDGSKFKFEPASCFDFFLLLGFL